MKDDVHLMRPCCLLLIHDHVAVLVTTGDAERRIDWQVGWNQIERLSAVRTEALSKQLDVQRRSQVQRSHGRAREPM
ncbi:hypothetical protein TOK_5639 [Pseudonocardia sp. N23]|nr:hypothetical protein TOK_5639 [Pseudonocardia sp. N23]